MITRNAYLAAQGAAVELLRQAHIVARDDELGRIEVTDLGLSRFPQVGLQILTLVDTASIGVKLLLLTPQQTFAEHWHPPLGDYPGKEETLRCQWGELRLYVPGEPSPSQAGSPPDDRRQYYTASHEIILRPGDQYTVPPNTPHWFQAGPEGAVVWSVSTKATDAEDRFTDPDVVRKGPVLAP